MERWQLPLMNGWRLGGEKEVQFLHGSGAGRTVNAASASHPREGWRPGLLLAPVYAPVVTRTRVEQRDRFRELVSSVIESASYSCRLVLGGDFNGEVGATKDASWRHVMGPYGDSRRTVGGEELLKFCEQEGLMVADTYTRQRRKETWYHFSMGRGTSLIIFLWLRLSVVG